MSEELWNDVVMSIVSDRRLNSWKIKGLSTGDNIQSFFPLSNATVELPSPPIEEALNGPNSEYSRRDLLISIRALKIIEQTVYAKTSGIARPLTVSLSVTGSCEISPSFVSVLNAMGTVASYGHVRAEAHC